MQVVCVRAMAAAVSSRDRRATARALAQKYLLTIAAATVAETGNAPPTHHTVLHTCLDV